MKKNGKKGIVNKYKAEKMKICESFERMFDDNMEFDAYIGTI